MPTIEYDNSDVCVSIDFEVFCGRCGAGLCGKTTTGRTARRGMPYINVDPCEHCLEKACDEVRSE